MLSNLLMVLWSLLHSESKNLNLSKQNSYDTAKTSGVFFIHKLDMTALMTTFQKHCFRLNLL